MPRNTFLFFGVGTVACLAIACSSPADTGGGTGGAGAMSGMGAAGGMVATGGAGGSSGSGGNAAAVLDCPGLFDCATQCAENDDPCQDGCYNAGSSSAQVAADALVACIVQFNCADEACILTNCEAALIECAMPTGGSQPPPGGPPPAGNVPADLVGQWAEGGPSSPSYSLVFGQDGSLARLRDVTIGVCQSTAEETGLAEADGSAMTLTFTSAHFVNCGKAQDVNDPYQEQYTYFIEAVPADEFNPLGLRLQLQQVNCGAACQSQTVAKIQ